MKDARRHLVPLGEGVYTVSEVCRILQPNMTPRKVHYWLDTGLLGEPVAWGRRGRPTLLNFQHLLQIRTVQRLRDELDFSLPRVRKAFAWLLAHMFAEDRLSIRFERRGRELVVVTGAGEEMTVPGGQGVLVPEHLTREVETVRTAWDERAYRIPGKPLVVSNARVVGGAPTVDGTRIETALIASFAVDGRYDDTVVRQLVALYPRLTPDSVRQAMEFEGVDAAA